MANSSEKNLILSNQKTSKFLEILIIFACIFSNFSQLPIDKISDSLRLCAFGIWFSILFLSFILYGKRIKLNGILYLTPLLIFDIVLFSLQLITGISYTSSSFFYPIHLSAFIFVVSYICGQFISEKSFINIMKFYVLSTLIVGVYIFFTYFLKTDWLNSNIYVYGSKNSISQIVLFAAILTFVYKFFNKKIFNVIVILFFILFMLALKSRAVLVGLVLVTLYVIFFIIKNNLAKCWIAIFLSLGIIAVFTIEPLFEIFINNIFLNNRTGYDLNVLSSGRINHIFIFIDKFKNSPFLGNGYVYIESFPLGSLASFGIFNGILLIIFSFVPLYISIKLGDKNNKSSIYYVLMMFNIAALSNGIFEELAPFGPGVKCYMLWLVAGIYLAMYEKEQV